tara:strand:- start:32 stop:841 length:810 start_codon:yes stop_codon:yes gene_type:complete
MNQKEEKALRESIRYLIQHVKQKRVDEEKELRRLIGEMAVHEYSLLEKKGIGAVDPPTDNTGINKLNDVLGTVVPRLEQFYKSLTSSIEQRKSFRAHILKAIVNELTPVEMNIDAAEGGSVDTDTDPIKEDINIDIDGDETDPDKFIDIGRDPDEEEEELTPEEEFGKDLGLEGEDETGRNFAHDAWEAVKGVIVPVYAKLGDPEDQELFHDYLIANIKLYFNQFEDELADAIEEPTNQAYDDAAQEQEEEVAPESPEELALQEYVNSL